MHADYTQIFRDYFAKQFWGNKTGSSGPNSDPLLTPILRKNLADLLKKVGVQSLFDAGCGDANLFKTLFVEGALPEGFTYTGYECVPELTARNQDFFDTALKARRPGLVEAEQAALSFKFKTGDVVKDPIPKADLILCRDVVHYLPNPLIHQFLENCQASGAKFLLITHNIYSEDSANSETEVGIFRPVNLTQRPFFWGAPVLTIQEDVFAKELALYELGHKFLGSKN
jgi:hypothetical protein